MTNFLKKHWKKIVILILFLLTLKLITGAVNSSVEAQPDASDSNSLSTIEVSDHQSITEIIYSSGEVISENQATIRSEASSPIEAYHVSVGDRVYAGDILVTFRHDDLKAQLSQASSSVSRAQNALNSQLIGARSEDRAKTQIALDQAKLGLSQAQFNFEQTRLNQNDSASETEERINQLYTTSLNSLDSSKQALVGGLATIADLQTEFFNCTSSQICYSISKEKGNAVETFFDENNADRWNAASIRNLNSGYADNLESLQASITPDWQLRSEILDALLSSLKQTQTSLTFVQEGFTQAVGISASTTQIAEASAALANVNANISTLEALKSSISTTEGFGYIGGEPKAIDDARRQAFMTLSNSEIAVKNAELTLQIAEQNLLTMNNGPRSIDLVPFYLNISDAQASYDRVSSQLRRVVVRAPFSGVVASAAGNPGELVPAGQPLITLVEPKAIEIKAFVSDKDLGTFNVNSVVSINNTYTGVITFVSPSINPQTRKVEVHVAVLEQTNLLVGQYVDIEISSKNSDDNFYYLPLESVRQSQSGAVVYRVNNEDIIEEVSVTTGKIINETIEITEGLSVTDTLIFNARAATVGEVVTE